MNNILIYFLKFLIQILILQIDIYIYIYHDILKLIMLSNSFCLSLYILY